MSKILAIIFALILPFGALAVEDGGFDEYYKKIIKSPRDKSINYTKFRLLYSKTKEYDPSYDRYDNLLTEAIAFYQSKKYVKAIETAKKILELEPINTTAYNVIALSENALGNKETAESFYFIYERLVDSIMSGGQMGNIEKPFKIVTHYEQAILLDILGLEYKSSVNIMEPHYTWAELDTRSGYGEIFSTIKKDTGEEWAVYFNTSIPVLWAKQKQ